MINKLNVFSVPKNSKKRQAEAVKLDISLGASSDSERKKREADRLLKSGISERYVRLSKSCDVIDTPSTLACELFPDFGIFVLSGSVGCGKTYAASKWLMSVSSKSFADIFLVKSAYFARSSRYDSDKLYERLYRVRNLVLDDLGTEFLDKKGSFCTDLGELIDHRYDSDRSTLITTNLEPASFKDRYGLRLYDRVRDSDEWNAVSVDSLRGGV